MAFRPTSASRPPCALMFLAIISSAVWAEAHGASAAKIHAINEVPKTIEGRFIAVTSGRYFRSILHLVRLAACAIDATSITAGRPPWERRKGVFRRWFVVQYPRNAVL